MPYVSYITVTKWNMWTTSYLSVWMAEEGRVAVARVWLNKFVRVGKKVRWHYSWGRVLE